MYPGEFHFIWVGPSEKGTQKRIEYEVSLLGLGDDFTLVGESDEVKQYYEQADLFFLSSREDPYPLVMLEAAYFKLPVLYFKNSGGAEEFFNFVPFEIPFGDCQSAAIKIRRTLDTIGEFEKELDDFKAKAIACDSEIVIPKIIDFILSDAGSN